MEKQLSQSNENQLENQLTFLEKQLTNRLKCRVSLTISNGEAIKSIKRESVGEAIKFFGEAVEETVREAVSLTIYDGEAIGFFR